jgi:general secretion pathway protein G
MNTSKSIKLSHPHNNGFTIIELMFVIVIIGLLAAVALPQYQKYQEKTKIAVAIQDISKLEEVIKIYYMENSSYPNTLADIGQSGKLDPWGSVYQYYNIDKNGIGRALKDKSLIPINSDFDLYSMGKDKKTTQQLSRAFSKDDIIRASNGSFLDIASKY